MNKTIIIHKDSLSNNYLIRICSVSFHNNLKISQIPINSKKKCPNIATNLNRSHLASLQKP